MADYGEILLKAVETVVDGKLEKLAFDKTIVCSIMGNANAAKGEYTVSDGATTFVAYSENQDYTIGTAVYVNIPNGDFSKQKMITGKYVSTQGDYYTYKTPWASFVDITGDILIDDPVGYSILANGEVEGDISNEQISEVEIYNTPVNDGKNYSAIGLKADFKTMIANLGASVGTYGLRLYIRTKNENVALTRGNPYRTFMAQLATTDMIGNPYSFETFYNQQKVFDVSGMGEIVNIKVTLFQKNNFYTGNGLLMRHKDDLDKNLKNNIFVNNIYLALGYSIADFNGNMVMLYASGSDTYSADYGRDADENKKTLKVRWINRDETTDEIRAFTEMGAVGEKGRIHWYKRNENPNVADELAGAFWEEVTEWRDTFEQTIDCFDYVNDQNVTYKVIVETPVQEYLLRDAGVSEEANKAISERDEAEQALQTAQMEYDYFDSEPNRLALAQAQRDYEAAMERYAAAVEPYIAETQLLESEEVTFTNEHNVDGLDILDLIQALKLEVDAEGYKGIYSIYDESGHIRNAVEANKARTITASYKSTKIDDGGIEDAEAIVWYIPIVNTMIEMPEIGKEYSEFDEIGTSPDGYYMTITRASNSSIGVEFEKADTQFFRIKKEFMPQATNNIIKCYVTKGGQLFEAQAELTFGPDGTNGTDFILTTKMESDRTCLYPDQVPLCLYTTLYDYNKAEVPHAQEKPVTYSWWAQDDIIKVGFCDSNGDLLDTEGKPIITVDENLTGKLLAKQYTVKADADDNHLRCYIRYLTDTEIQTLNKLSDAEFDKIDTTPLYCIVSAKITIKALSPTKDLDAVLLNTELPIPFATDYAYTAIEGADRVIYNTAGTGRSYYNKPYRLLSGTEQVEGIEWKYRNGAKSITERRYYPIVSKDGVLVPLSTYVKDLSHQVSVVGVDKDGKIQWAQPILIKQNVYTSQMLNAWNGDMSIDEEKNTIMSAMIGAGYKDKQNRFNGVLMGDVKSKVDAAADTGLFGYHEGVQSFGFKTDGTGFIGSTGKGQLQFDGNSGRIQSMSFALNQTGMLIDLDDGLIDMRGNEVETVQNRKKVSIVEVTDFTANLNDIYAYIGDNKIDINDGQHEHLKKNIGLLSKYSRTPVKDLTEAEIFAIETALEEVRNEVDEIQFGEQKLTDYLEALTQQCNNFIISNNEVIKEDEVELLDIKINDEDYRNSLKQEIKDAKAANKELTETLKEIDTFNKIVQDIDTYKGIQAKQEVYNTLLAELSALQDEYNTKTVEQKQLTELINQLETELNNPNGGGLVSKINDAKKDLLELGTNTSTDIDSNTYTQRDNAYRARQESLVAYNKAVEAFDEINQQVIDYKNQINRLKTSINQLKSNNTDLINSYRTSFGDSTLALDLSSSTALENIPSSFNIALTDDDKAGKTTLNNETYIVIKKKIDLMQNLIDNIVKKINDNETALTANSSDEFKQLKQRYDSLNTQLTTAVNEYNAAVVTFNSLVDEVRNNYENVYNYIEGNGLYYENLSRSSSPASVLQADQERYTKQIQDDKAQIQQLDNEIKTLEQQLATAVASGLTDNRAAMEEAKANLIYYYSCQVAVGNLTNDYFISHQYINITDLVPVDIDTAQEYIDNLTTTEIELLNIYKLAKDKYDSTNQQGSDIQEEINNKKSQKTYYESDLEKAQNQLQNTNIAIADLNNLKSKIGFYKRGFQYLLDRTANENYIALNYAEMDAYMNDPAMGNGRDFISSYGEFSVGFQSILSDTLENYVKIYNTSVQSKAAQDTTVQSKLDVVNGIKDQLEKITPQYESEIAKLESSNNNLQEDNTELRNKKFNYEYILNNWDIFLINKKSELASIKLSIISNNKLINDSEATIKKLETDNSGLTKPKEQAKTNRDNAKTDYDNKDKQYQDIQGEINKAISKQSAQLAIEYEDKQKIVLMLEDEQTVIDNQKRDAQKQIDNLSKDLIQLEANIKKLGSVDNKTGDIYQAYQDIQSETNKLNYQTYKSIEPILDLAPIIAAHPDQNSEEYKLAVMQAYYQKITTNTFSEVLPTTLINNVETTPTYKTTQSKVRISTTSPYFEVMDTAGQSLIEASDKNYYLQSSGYNESVEVDGSGGKGIKLDLSKGKLTGYNFTLKSTISEDADDNKPSQGMYNGSYISLSSLGTASNPFLRVHYSKWENNTVKVSDIHLLDITRDNFVLHSQNWVSNTSGLELNLTKGTLKAFSGFDLRAYAEGDRTTFIHLSSSGNPFLRIQKGGKKLMDITNTTFVLQSQNWDGANEGIQLDLTRGNFRSFSNFNLKTVITKGNLKDSYIQLATASSAFNFTVHYSNDGNKQNVNLFEISNNKFEMYSQNWGKTYELSNATDPIDGITYYIDKTGNTKAVFTDSNPYTAGVYYVEKPTGINFDMSNGKITAYEFTIKAYGPHTGYNSFISIDSTAGAATDLTNYNAKNYYPFRIKGPNGEFKVNWNGEIFAENIISNLATLGPFKFTSGSMYTGENKYGGSGIYLGVGTETEKTGFSIANKFFVNSKGEVTTGSTLTTNGSTYIRGNLYITGQIIGNNWGVGGESSDTGAKGTIASFGRINATGGMIGGWEISGSVLRNGDNIVLDPVGTILVNGAKIYGAGSGNAYYISVGGEGNYYGTGSTCLGIGGRATNIYGNPVNFHGLNSIQVNGNTGRSGTVHYLDGSTLVFENGICTGGTAFNNGN